MTPELAAEIADETTHILGHNVLITDENARSSAAATSPGWARFMKPRWPS